MDKGAVKLKDDREADGEMAGHNNGCFVIVKCSGLRMPTLNRATMSLPTRADKSFERSRMQGWWILHKFHR